MCSVGGDYVQQTDPVYNHCVPMYQCLEHDMTQLLNWCLAGYRQCFQVLGISWQLIIHCCLSILRCCICQSQSSSFLFVFLLSGAGQMLTVILRLLSGSELQHVILLCSSIYNLNSKLQHSFYKSYLLSNVNYKVCKNTRSWSFCRNLIFWND